MKITNDKLNFGMAFYCQPEDKLIANIGEKATKEVTEARPLLEELAQDCDIYLVGQSSKSKDLRMSKIKISVYPLEKNPIKRLFRNRRLHLVETVDTYPKLSMKASLLEKATGLVRIFKQYK